MSATIEPRLVYLFRAQNHVGRTNETRLGVTNKTVAATLAAINAGTNRSKPFEVAMWISGLQNENPETLVKSLKNENDLALNKRVDNFLNERIHKLSPIEAEEFENIRKNMRFPNKTLWRAIKLIFVLVEEKMSCVVHSCIQLSRLILPPLPATITIVNEKEQLPDRQASETAVEELQNAKVRKDEKKSQTKEKRKRKQPEMKTKSKAKPIENSAAESAAPHIGISKLILTQLIQLQSDQSAPEEVRNVASKMFKGALDLFELCKPKSIITQETKHNTDDNDVNDINDVDDDDVSEDESPTKRAKLATSTTETQQSISKSPSKTKTAQTSPPKPVAKSTSKPEAAKTAPSSQPKTVSKNTPKTETTPIAPTSPPKPPVPQSSVSKSPSQTETVQIAPTSPPKPPVPNHSVSKSPSQTKTAQTFPPSPPKPFVSQSPFIVPETPAQQQFKAKHPVVPEEFVDPLLPPVFPDDQCHA